MSNTLTFRLRPTPTFDEMSPLLIEQLGPLLDQARHDGSRGYELIELFDVLDAHGHHVYDLHLFCGDDGQLHRKGTVEHVASFSQGGATASGDAALLEALNDAYDQFRASRKKVASAPKAKPAAAMPKRVAKPKPTKASAAGPGAKRSTTKSKTAKSAKPERGRKPSRGR